MAIPKEEITIRVPSWFAQEYREARGQKRLKMEMLMGLRIRDALEDKKTLAEVEHDFPWLARSCGFSDEDIISILSQVANNR